MWFVRTFHHYITCLHKYALYHPGIGQNMCICMCCLCFAHVQLVSHCRWSGWAICCGSPLPPTPPPTTCGCHKCTDGLYTAPPPNTHTHTHTHTYSLIDWEQFIIVIDSIFGSCMYMYMDPILSVPDNKKILRSSGLYRVCS